MDYRLKLLLVLLVFSVSLLTRAPLVDTCYTYSFEPDSPGGIQRTRSFYFFFQNPIPENFPHTLSAFPTYFDGYFITSALMANLIRPVAKLDGVLPYLSDSDNSLVIFSMRWTSVLLYTLTAVLVLLIICSLTQNNFLALTAVLVYFIFSKQQLDVALIRVDHYGVFSGTLVLWAAIKLHQEPLRLRWAIVTGIACGLACATKLNFMFYFTSIVLTVGYLLYKKTIPLHRTFPLVLAFFITVAFLFQRWLMYHENVVPTLQEIMSVGQEWYSYWGNDNYGYFHWDQFYENTSPVTATFVILLFYASLITVFSQAWQQKNTLMFLLLLAFVGQSVLLVFSPKVGRYGLMIPVWATVFIALANVHWFTRVPQSKWRGIGGFLLWLPISIYAASNYKQALTTAIHQQQSLTATRLAAREWIKENISAGSTIAVQHPRASNPPIYDLPYFINDHLLPNRFLSKNNFCETLPPPYSQLSREADILITNDKETDYHLFTARQYACTNKLETKWQLFFDSLTTRFAHQHFSSPYPNYGVKNYQIFTLVDTPRQVTVPQLTVTTYNDSDEIKHIQWHFLYRLGENPNRFQIQIAEDSTMRWLVYGSRDGFTSKYRLKTRPQQLSMGHVSFIPKKVEEALQRGAFKPLLGDISPTDIRPQLESLFASIYRDMEALDITFEESALNNFNESNGAEQFLAIMSSIYPHAEELEADEYLEVTGLPFTNGEALIDQPCRSFWDFKVPIRLHPNKQYYCRVRAKQQEVIFSHWSPITKL